MTNTLVSLEDGWVDERIVDGTELFETELERIFAPSWSLIAHESELSCVGNYVTSKVGEDPIVVIRGEDGVVRAFLNACRHRANMVCRQAAGSAEVLVCERHGWTYDLCGVLVEIGGVPADRLIEPGWDLVRAKGLIHPGGWLCTNWYPAPGQQTDDPQLTEWTDALATIGVPSTGPAIRTIERNWKLVAIALDRLHGLSRGGSAPAGVVGPWIAASEGLVQAVVPIGARRTQVRTWRTGHAGSHSDLAERFDSWSPAGDDLPLFVMRDTPVSVRSARSPATIQAPPQVAADGCPTDESTRPIIRRSIADPVVRAFFVRWCTSMEASTLR